MRKIFIENKSRYIVKELCPWASFIVRVADGFMCFESVIDFKIWKDQK